MDRPRPTSRPAPLAATRFVPLVLSILAALGASPAGAAQGGTPTLAQGRVLPASDTPGAVLSPRERVEPINRMLQDRLETLLPKLMREAGLDLWLVVNREYAEDPVYFTLVPEPTHAARRTTMLIFHDLGVDPETGEDRGVERLTVSRYPLGGPYEAAWQGGDLDAQWAGLAEVLAARDPYKIAVDVSRDWPVADGLTASLHDRLIEALQAGPKPEQAERLVPAEDLVIRWMETRTAMELEVWPHVVALARGVIAEAFSGRTITPGVTTTEDVAWFISERFTALDLPIWFQPSVDVQRRGIECTRDDPFCGAEGEGVVIRPGDVLHTDVGICYLRLCTDTQEMAYVPEIGRSGQASVPSGLRHALAVGNQWQDLLTGSFETGRTGNEILAATRAAQDEESIVGSVYSHPLGYFGHAPGPTIGMWDNQGPTPVRGDWTLHPSTGYAVEGNVKVQVPEWNGQWVEIKLEQSAVFAPAGSDEQGVIYLAGRQTEWLVVE